MYTRSNPFEKPVTKKEYARIKKEYEQRVLAGLDCSGCTKEEVQEEVEWSVKKMMEDFVIVTL